jgi:hypothetical protein
MLVPMFGRIVSVSNFSQADHHARRYGPVGSQRYEIPIIPTSKSDYLSVLSRRARDLEKLQYVEPLAVEKKSVSSKKFRELNDYWIIVFKHLYFKLGEGAVYLSFS